MGLLGSVICGGGYWGPAGRGSLGGEGWIEGLLGREGIHRAVSKGWGGDAGCFWRGGSPAGGDCGASIGTSWGALDGAP